MAFRRSLWGMGGLCVVLCSVAATCGAPRPTRLAGAGVTAFEAWRAIPARVSGGAVVSPGDFVLAGGGTRVIVGGMQRGGESRGAVLEALGRGMPPDDGVVLLGPRVYRGQHFHPVAIADMYLVARGGRPAVRMEGTARVSGHDLRVAREVTLGDRGQWLSITTRVASRDGEALSGVRVGGRMGWGGAPPFVPGVGPVEDEDWHEANWLGREGDVGAVGFAFHEAPLRTRATYERHGDARFLSHTEVTSARVDVPAGGFARTRGALAVVHGGLGEAVRRLGWARGAPFREVWVTLPYVPEGTRVLARLEDGRPVVRSRPDARGQMLLPLPPIGARPAAARHVLVASAYGHADSDPVAVGLRDRRAVLHIPRGGRIRVSVSDARGYPMPGRVRFIGAGRTATPLLGPDWRADGAGDTVVTVDGEVVVPLPPGRYEVIVTHGPEWSLLDRTVEVTETFQPHVEADLVHRVDPGNWIGCDFHVHAAPSYDSEVHLDDRIASLVAEGVSFAVATDHNTVTDYGPTVQAMHLDGFGTVPGVEATTWDPAFGHFNAYPYPRDPEERGNGAPPYKHTSPAELFAAMRQAGEGVVVQVNHPRLEPDIGYFDLMGLDPETGSASDAYSDDYDVLEVFNGFDLARPERVEQVFRDWLALLARGKRVVANGSSDSHQVHYQWAGYPRTYVQVDDPAHPDGEQVVRGLLAGRAFVTVGPFVDVSIGDRGLGEVAAPTDGVLPVHVKVRAPEWMNVDTLDLFVGPELARTVPLAQPRAKSPPVVRFDGTVELPAPAQDSFVVVRVAGHTTLDRFFGREEIPPLAFTNPIWVDADGDGRVPWVTP